MRKTPISGSAQLSNPQHFEGDIRVRLEFGYIDSPRRFEQLIRASQAV